MPPVSCSLFHSFLPILSLSLSLARSLCLSVCLVACLWVSLSLSLSFVICWSGNVDLTPTIPGRRACGRAKIGVMDVRFEAAEPGSERCWAAVGGFCSVMGTGAPGTGRQSQDSRGGEGGWGMKMLRPCRPVPEG